MEAHTRIDIKQITQLNENIFLGMKKSKLHEDSTKY
jgi:hypothetical protein